MTTATHLTRLFLPFRRAALCGVLLGGPLCGGAALVPGTARAQALSEAGVALAARPAEPGTMTLAAHPLTARGTIRIDGRLDESAWALAPVATGFTQREPNPGAPASERTEVRVLYDSEALYVGFRAYVSDPATLVGPLARRDAFPVADRVSVDIDSYGDGRTAFSFALTLSGTKQDLLVYDDVSEDVGWDAVWAGEVARFEGPEGAGYTAEFRIPFAQLRYPPGQGPQVWGIQFQRDIPATGETVFWAPILPDREGYVSRFGRLTGLSALPAVRRVELLPYVATRLTRAPGDAADPFYAPNAFAPALGLDAKLGLTSGLTLTATLNPDFGQVEADPADVNLSAFETFFEERRPFFVEGTDVFAFGGTRTSSVSNRPTFFYSRRIGREPASFDRLYPDSAYVYLRAPEQTTIAAAGKLSGQVGSWSVGVLSAATTPERAAYVSPDGARREARVAPAASYSVARVRRAWRGGGSTLGGFASAALRDAGGPFAPVLPGRAVVAGLDGEHAFAGRAWTLSGVLAGSSVAGDAALVSALQRAPQRFFQRPDAAHLALDPDATRLEGYRAELSLAKTGGGRHWRGSATLGAVSPGFEVNDLGFQTRADLLAADAFVEYVQPRAERVRRWSVFGIANHGWSYGGDRVIQAYRAGTFTQLRNLWVVSTVFGLSPEHVNDRLTRGGPLALRPADVSGSLRVSSDARRAVRGTLRGQARHELPHAHDAGTKWVWALFGDVSYRPSLALDLSLRPEYVRRFDTDQYLGARPDPVAEATFGRRYLFADIRQDALFLGFRADWTFSPDLTLQLYAAPYVATGRFHGFKQLRAPRTFDFDVFGRDRGTVTPQVTGPAGTYVPTDDFDRAERYVINPGDGGSAFAIANRSFNYRSLRGNAVLRWEWRPGSTLFFVWQQVRDDFAAYDGFRLGDELGEVFRAPPENVFLVKASYWFGR
ncbi:MAG: DUF5916 domain-containing protein [Rubricoccaceae bacterium]